MDPGIEINGSLPGTSFFDLRALLLEELEN
jgi:hypothetical protein